MFVITSSAYYTNLHPRSVIFFQVAHAPLYRSSDIASFCGHPDTYHCIFKRSCSVGDCDRDGSASTIYPPYEWTRNFISCFFLRVTASIWKVLLKTLLYVYSKTVSRHQQRHRIALCRLIYKYLSMSLFTVF